MQEVNQLGYKRQMEIYQWIFCRNGSVAETSCLVYCNGRTDEDVLDVPIECD
jgi:hypothetical protein